MKIVITSVLVDDQDKALAFYRDMLGFVLKHDIPMGGDARWLTLTSPGDADGVELLLEPDMHPAARPFKTALRAGLPGAGHLPAQRRHRAGGQRALRGLRLLRAGLPL